MPNRSVRTNLKSKLENTCKNPTAKNIGKKFGNYCEKRKYEFLEILNTLEKKSVKTRPSEEGVDYQNDFNSNIANLDVVSKELEPVFKDDEDFKRIMFPETYGKDYFDDRNNEDTEVFVLSDFEKIIFLS